jgi:hypothetical protein
MTDWDIVPQHDLDEEVSRSVSSSISSVSSTAPLTDSITSDAISNMIAAQQATAATATATSTPTPSSPTTVSSTPSGSRYSFDRSDSLQSIDARRFELKPFSGNNNNSTNSNIDNGDNGSKSGHNRVPSTFVDMTDQKRSGGGSGMMNQHSLSPASASSGEDNSLIAGSNGSNNSGSSGSSTTPLKSTAIPSSAPDFGSIDDDDNDNDNDNDDDINDDHNQHGHRRGVGSGASGRIGRLAPHLSLTGEVLPSSITIRIDNDRPLPPPPRVRPVTHIVFTPPPDMYSHDPGFTRHYGHAPVFLTPTTPATPPSGHIAGNNAARSAPASPAHRRTAGGNSSNGSNGNNSRGSGSATSSISSGVNASPSSTSSTATTVVTSGAHSRTRTGSPLLVPVSSSPSVPLRFIQVVDHFYYHVSCHNITLTLTLV